MYLQASWSPHVYGKHHNQTKSASHRYGTMPSSGWPSCTCRVCIEQMRLGAAGAQWWRLETGLGGLSNQTNLKGPARCRQPASPNQTERSGFLRPCKPPQGSLASPNRDSLFEYIRTYLKSSIDGLFAAGRALHACFATACKVLCQLFFKAFTQATTYQARPLYPTTQPGGGGSRPQVTCCWVDTSWVKKSTRGQWVAFEKIRCQLVAHQPGAVPSLLVEANLGNCENLPGQVPEQVGAKMLRGSRVLGHACIKQ